mmetsp:Transcript_3071/g.8688  ORF Transcript_3071/g.8688 Transcript_3071/m.8688 type:complete len:134 (-) Transcript_3071:2242-2643(-)
MAAATMASPRLGPRPEEISAFAAEHEVALDDGTSRNERAVDFIREKWIERQLQEREAEFTSLVPGTLFCGTWNVNGKKIEDEVKPKPEAKPKPNPRRKAQTQTPTPRIPSRTGSPCPTPTSSSTSTPSVFRRW